MAYTPAQFPRIRFLEIFLPRNWDRVTPLFWVLMISLVLIIIGVSIRGGFAILWWLGGFVWLLVLAYMIGWLNEKL